jgi:hypothetical protein
MMIDVRKPGKSWTEGEKQAYGDFPYNDFDRIKTFLEKHWGLSVSENSVLSSEGLVLQIDMPDGGTGVIKLLNEGYCSMTVVSYFLGELADLLAEHRRRRPQAAQANGSRGRV